MLAQLYQSTENMKEYRAKQSIGKMSIDPQHKSIMWNADQQFSSSPVFNALRCLSEFMSMPSADFNLLASNFFLNLDELKEPSTMKIEE
jgi:hypothetical protein